nr:unnamed protein product [Callosobruchus chinensis]
MNQGLLLAAITASMAFFVCTEGKTPFELIEGNCTSAVMGDMVLLKYSSRQSIPLQEREAKVEWHGDETLYCLMVLSDQKVHNNSYIDVTKGGVNHSFVELRMFSDIGYGFQYWVRGFGKKGNKALAKMKQALFSVIAIAAFVPIFCFSVQGKPSFEIEDGKCSSAVMGDLLYLDYVEKWSIPLVKRSEVVKHHGDEKIYCVMVKSQQHGHHRSTVEITKGGVNHTFVEISLKSDVGYGYFYIVYKTQPRERKDRGT